MDLTAKVEALGLANHAARVYAELLSSGPLQAQTLAQRLHIARPHVYATLRRLTEQGYVVEQAGQLVKEFAAVPAPAAFRSELRRARESLRLRQKLVRELAEVRPDRSVDTVRGNLLAVMSQARVVDTVRRFIRKARRQINVLWTYDPDEPSSGRRESHRLELAALRRGVGFRVVFEPGCLKHEWLHRRVVGLARAGAEFGIAEDLPMDLFTVDDLATLFYVGTDQRGSPTFFSEQRAMVRLMNHAFEDIWNRRRPHPWADRPVARRQSRE